MRGWKKKATAVFLAGAMLLGSYGITYAEGADENTTTASTVTVLTEAVYDEVLIFEDGTVFLENGHWPTYYGNDVSTDTKLIFMDLEGNKKVIQNQDSFGEMLFDAVCPPNNSYYYNSGGTTLLKVYKGDKCSYIKSDGSFFGDTLVYYNDAEALSDEALLVTDDNGKYSVINSEGNVTVNSDKFNGNTVRRRVTIGNCVYLMFQDTTMILDKSGNLIRKYEQEGNIRSLGCGYAEYNNSEKTRLINSNGEVVAEFEPEVQILYNVDLLENGMVGVVEDIYKESVEGTVREQLYRIIDMDTKKVLFEDTKWVNYMGEGILVVREDNKTLVKNETGAVCIEDLEQYVEDVGKEAGYNEVVCCISPQCYIINTSLAFSLADPTDASKVDTFFATRENDYAVSDVKKISGAIGEFSDSGEYFITTTLDGYLKSLCTVDGTEIKTYSDSKELRYFYPLYDDYAFEGKPEVLFESYKYDYEQGKSSYQYLLSDGTISDTYLGYSRFSKDRNFFLGYGEDNTISVLNPSGEKVYTKSANEVSLSSLDNFNCFYARDMESGRCYLYDMEGNLIFGEDGEYTAIGYNYYSCSYKNNYFYGNNTDKSSGLCPIQKTVDNKTKYGAIIIKGGEIEEDESETVKITKPAAKETYVSLENIKPIKAGETAKVSVKLNKDVNLDAFEFRIELNTEKVELVTEPVENPKYSFYSDAFLENYSGFVEQNYLEETKEVVLTGAADNATKLPAGTVIAEFEIRAKEDLSVNDIVATERTTVLTDEENGISIENNEAEYCIVALMTLGDVNNDTAIDANDALAILKSVAKMITLTDIQIQAADVNKDNSVDANDALMILKYVAKMIEGF